MRSTPTGAGLPSTNTFLFNIPIRALLPQINREPTNFNADNEYYQGLKTCQDKYTKSNGNHKDPLSFSTGSRVTVQCDDDGHMAHWKR